MATIPAPSLNSPQEEWLDADFDFPDGEPIILPAPSDDKDAEDEDWDEEMGFNQQNSQSLASASRIIANFKSDTTKSQPQSFTIRPPLQDIGDEDELDDGDEGVSTIKVTALQATLVPKQQLPEPIPDDFEDAFALPSDLTQLLLPTLPLSHRSSKNSLEWGDKDQTTSSQSSDAYSTLSLHDGSPSSNSVTSASAPESETDFDDEDEDNYEGLVLPSALFETGQGARQLMQLLESKKKAQVFDHLAKVSSPDPEDDFEAGLVISDDVDLSPSRLLSKPLRKGHIRSSTAPPSSRPPSLRPPSRTNRSKSPSNPPTSSARQLQRIRLSPSPPLRPPTRSQTFQPSSISPPPDSSSSLVVKPASLRGQKSSSALKPPTPPATHRTLSRKASLSALIEASHQQPSGSGSSSVVKSRYEEPTVASKAKSHKFSTSRNSDYKVPPTRPHTPSANPAALRLTMPAQTRNKIRPALSAVFTTPTPTPSGPTPRATSPSLPRAPSATCLRSVSSRLPSNHQPLAPKLLRKPKRLKAYGDGTELDGFEDLPTDRDKEGKYQVQAKGYGNRASGVSNASKVAEKSETRATKTRRESINAGSDQVPLGTATNTLRRTTTRLELTGKVPNAKTASPNEKHGKKKKNATSPTSSARRKPTLIRHLGGTAATKVVGDMRWNPLTLRWEGNDSILRDFDAVVGSSTRPALITHLTGSSLGSPCGSFASGARIVGNMIFDPVKMCWISTLAPDEEEPDVFANLADDENDSDAWESKGGTIRASLPTQSTATSVSSSTSSLQEAPSPTRSHTRTLSESGSDRGSRASMVFDVDESFAECCRQAEERHRAEMKGWISALSKHDVFSTTTDRSSLYEIRALATRKY